jgi:hypothetical protein
LGTVKDVRRKTKKTPKLEKRIDETHYLNKKQGGGILKEEVWHAGGKVAKYSLAYINHAICAVDNGRVLGYDSDHGRHHRHYMGKFEAIEFTGYEALLDRFRQELEEIWRVQREQKR